MKVELEKDATGINDVSTEAFPADQYGTDERRRSSGLVDGFDLALVDGMYVGLCHRDSILSKVKFSSG